MKPLNELTCSDVLTFLGQKDGLPWLAKSVAEFASNYPDAEIEFYPGDFTMAALRLLSEIKAVDEAAAAQLAMTDLTWMIDRYDFDPSLWREANELVAAVKA